MGYFNIYGQYVDDGQELYHHGVKGQKWGKKNGPPYPLRAGDHSASEKKAGWRKSLSKGADDFKRSAKKVAKGVKTGIKTTGKAVKKGTEIVDAFRLRRAERDYRKVKRDNLNSSLKRMSDTELNNRIKRLQNEDTYKRLIGAKTQGDISAERRNRARTLVNSTLGHIGKSVVMPIATGYVIYRVKSSAAKKHGYAAPDYMDEVFNKVGAKYNHNNNNNGNNNNNNNGGKKKKKKKKKNGGNN